jgi:hypothetical protein
MNVYFHLWFLPYKKGAVGRRGRNTETSPRSIRSCSLNDLEHFQVNDWEPVLNTGSPVQQSEFEIRNRIGTEINGFTRTQTLGCNQRASSTSTLNQLRPLICPMKHISLMSGNVNGPARERPQSGSPSREGIT